MSRSAEQATGDIRHCRRLLDDRRLARRGQGGREQFPRQRPDVKASISYGQYAAGADLVGNGAVFPRHPRLGRHRPVRASKPIPAVTSPTAAKLWRDHFSSARRSPNRSACSGAIRSRRQDVTLDPASLAATPSLPIQQAALAGPQWVSAVGDTVSYNTLDNTKIPTNGINSQLTQDLAGLGGDVKFLRTTEDLRYYQSINSDLAGMVRAQGGYITGYGGQQVPLIEQLLRRPDHGARICAQRFRPARSDARHDHG